MRRIFKYPLRVDDVQVVAAPKGAVPIHVATQYGNPQLWAIVDDTAPIAPLVIRTAGTGHPLPDTFGDYVGTYQLADGALVFHVFNEGEKP